ncbi:MAG: 1-deoxy-D-xylulose-5-phosphate reductoisomerase [Chloroflexota bacterium]|nr:1-deoxy-D-xylulose-5-phosphate reductoisomerase [Chloroflexota bacterium]MDE2683099.1 1-deoxy-D-xylulose-5-phosphate reductoisomerase [Chloroflexota bacterium]
MRRIIVLGSTGSIGRQTLDIVRAFPDDFEVVGLAAGNNTGLLTEQIAEFHPRYIWCNAPPSPLPPDTTVMPMAEMSTLPEVDQVMVALMGAVGLSPTLEALKAGKQVALSNKEPIVMAGETLKSAEAEHGGVILPVDSEPSAIWQCLQGEENHIRRLMITASGGPFRRTPLAELESVTPDQALRHPTWRMGDKITIDSATLMNKAFEVIESHWLFTVPWEDIAVLVHPQSTIHSMVEFDDGSVKAQLGPPSMRLPIQYALFYPRRFANPDIPRLDIGAPWSLDFEPLEHDRFPCFDLAVSAGKLGGTAPAVLSAADEVAVTAFLQGKIGFTGIYRLVEQVLAEHQPQPDPDLEAITDADCWASIRASELAGMATT